MAQAEILKIFTLSWEGGWSDKKSDRGGKTNHGVTLKTFQQYYGQERTAKDLLNITEAQWWNIFKKGFWDYWQADRIQDQSIANIVVDWGWGSGQKTAAKIVQGVLGLKQDGVVGPKTLAALNGGDASEIFAKLWRRRKQHFETVAKLPGQSVNLPGWLNRLNGIKFGSLRCNTYRKYMGRQQRKVVVWRDGIVTEGWE